MKTILITGATGGIGSAMAQAFAAADYRVAIAYHRAENLSAAQELQRALPGSGHYPVQLAVDESDSVQDAFARIESEGGLDALINNAGHTRFVAHPDLDALDDAFIDSIFRVHVRGALACARAALPLMRANGGGVIINMTSVAAQIAVGSNIAYCAAKAALGTVTQSLARALAPDIRVNALAPGLVDTDFIRGLDDDWRAAQIAKTPIGRLTTPDEVAQAALMLAEMPACTGMTLAVDGGRPLAV